MSASASLSLPCLRFRFALLHDRKINRRLKEVGRRLVRPIRPTSSSASRKQSLALAEGGLRLAKFAAPHFQARPSILNVRFPGRSECVDVRPTSRLGKQREILIEIDFGLPHVAERQVGNLRPQVDAEQQPLAARRRLDLLGQSEFGVDRGLDLSEHAELLRHQLRVARNLRRQIAAIRNGLLQIGDRLLIAGKRGARLSAPVVELPELSAGGRLGVGGCAIALQACRIRLLLIEDRGNFRLAGSRRRFGRHCAGQMSEHREAGRSNHEAKNEHDGPSRAQ